MKLAVELVPRSAHFQNARAALTRAKWDRVKDETAKRADYQCEICGPCERIEAHEVWRWNETSATEGVQLLERTIALCPWCHRAKHWGFTEGTEFLVNTRLHILRVNNWTPEQLDEHVRASWREWVRLSKFTWTLDISVLDAWTSTVAKRTPRKKPAELSQGGPF